MLNWLFALLKVALLLIGTFVSFLLLTIRRIYNSVQVAPPTPSVAEKSCSGDSILFRYIPELKARIAWFPLGKYPTPVDSFRFDPNDSKFTIWIKREDYASELYGGNKVRGLEYLLACAAANLEKEKKGGVVVSIGGGGSNQIIATCVHAKKFGVETAAFWNFPEAASYDNSLNFLSGLSFPFMKILGFWTTPGPTVRKLLWNIWWSQNKIFNIGGAQPLGSLGQAGAMLELAEQLPTANADGPLDLHHIFLALGSGCTVAGLILGTVLARHLKLHAYPGLKLNAVIIHHQYCQVPRIIKWWVRKLVNDAALLLAQNGGPDVTGLIPAAVDELLVLHTEYAEEYGQMTQKGEEAKARFDRGTVQSSRAIPYLCSTFTSKSAACMLEFLRAHPEEATHTLFWASKSLNQPHGQRDSWQMFKDKSAGDVELKKWMADSNIHSSEDYLKRMSPVEFENS